MNLLITMLVIELLACLHLKLSMVLTPLDLTPFSQDVSSLDENKRAEATKKLHEKALFFFVFVFFFFLIWG